MTYCVFFDLDETVIKCKSMFEIIKAYFLQNSAFRWLGEGRFNRFQRKMRYFVRHNNNRKVQNKFYYRQLAGLSSEKMLRVSKKWVSDNAEMLFNAKVVYEIRKHQQQGAKIVLVTGSFLECAKPIAEYLGVPDIICAPLEQRDGYYTGRMLGEPNIGVEKACAILDYVEKNSLSLDNSYAYGDHQSDLFMLSISEHPTVVGNNPALLEFARKNQWSVIN